MRIDNPFFLLVGLFVLILGAIGCIYLIVFSLRRMRGKETTPQKTVPRGTGWFRRVMEWMSEPVSGSARDSRPSPSVAGPKQPTAARTEPTRSSPGEVFEVMRVLRRGAMGRLVIEVEGREYGRLVEIKDGALGRRVLLAIQELVDFAGEYGHRPLPETQRLDGSVEESEEQEPTLSARQGEFLAQLQEVQEETEDVRAKSGLVDYWRRGFSRTERHTAAKAAEEAPKSFIDEIEEMLQLRIAGRPDLDSHSVHFKSTATGDLQIEVDGGFYESIDDVPYPEIRSLLKATIVAWELG
jgi:hypothetical protein